MKQEEGRLSKIAITEISKERLKSTFKKLFQKNQFDDYETVFNQWIEDGVIEDNPFNEIEEKSHYLPHRGVFKELSTMKVRPVFDASCRGKNSSSLNNCLEKGQNLLEEIFSNLLRFRKEKNRRCV
ncbi:integrase catalytic domain-containing protein [Nephila pilipes]|uniref:Integrase catalytic domain-containing protein n=1 Tax=Nephila pilipes TaxID=299642 RepID=A0A8X6TX46_NEPPI|nr:integrase catalytic domain-containing protein [Nephila pilipes]